MAAKLNTKLVALSLAGVSGILYIICALLIAIAPTTTVNMFSNVFHGIDITQIAATNISLGNTILGLIEILVYSLVAGWVFAVVYNYLATKIR
ncbi:MAG: DUF5676 family membrane protein [archaeon]